MLTSIHTSCSQIEPGTRWREPELTKQKFVLSV